MEGKKKEGGEDPKGVRQTWFINELESETDLVIEMEIINTFPNSKVARKNRDVLVFAWLLLLTKSFWVMSPQKQRIKVPNVS